MNEAIAMYDAGERRTIGRMMVNHSASVFATEKVSGGGGAWGAQLKLALLACLDP
jgi:hypothetical protein